MFSLFEMLIQGLTRLKISLLLNFAMLTKQKSSQIHQQVVEIYGDNRMKDGIVREWER